MGYLRTDIDYEPEYRVDSEEDPRLFDERAKLRVKRKDYSGAVKDWKAAIDLAPKQAAYYANIAEAYIKLGKLSPALEYYREAIKLNPGNKDYAGKYKKLKGESS